MIDVRLSTEKFFQLSLELLCIANAEGYFVRVNPAFTETLGHTEEDLVSRPFLDFVHEDDREATLQVVAQLAAGEPVVRFENRYRHKDGSYRQLQWSTSVDEASGVLYAAARDITESAKAIASARAAEQRARTIVETVAEPVVTISTTGIIQSFNLAAQRAFGYSEAEVLGRNVKVLMPSHHALRHDGYLSRYLETGQSYIVGHTREVVALRKDGAMFPVELQVTETQAAGEHVFIGILRDLSHQKAIEAASEELARLEAESTAFTHCKAAVLAILNRRLKVETLLEQVLGVLASELRLTPSAVHLFDQWSGTLNLAASHGLPAGFEGTYNLGEGLVGQAAASRRVQIVEGAAQPLRLDTGVGTIEVEGVATVPIVHNEYVFGVLTVGIPTLTRAHREFVEQLAAQVAVAISNVRQYEQMQTLTAQLNERGRQIAQQNAELERASRLKSEFLANMSHELRTPLNAILGFSEVLRDGIAGELREQQRDYVQEIHGAGTHLLALINEILDLSKIEAGRLELNLEILDLEDLANNAITMVREAASTAGLQLCVERDEGVDSLRADRRRVRQILYNLLANAVKFTPAGGSVTLTIRGVEDDGGDWVVLQVEDTGIGISEEDRERLFTPFEQLDGSTSRSFEGTGLGLALVEKLVTLHGGHIEVESEVGRGSRFAVWLPVTHGPVEPVRPIESTPPNRVVAAPRVLLIEDDDRGAAVVQAALGAAGYEVVRASTGEEGLALSVTRAPDLIVLDLLLPERDGWSVLESLRKDPSTCDLPVVILSILGDENRQRGFALGAADVLQKPVTPTELVEALERQSVHASLDRPPRVLLVDDDPRSVEVIAVTLEDAGYTVSRSYGGEDALHVARTERPDILIVDLMMPAVSGFELIDAFRSDEALRSTPIYVLTAKSLTDAERSALAHRIEGFSEKHAFRVEDFMQEVARLAPYRRPSQESE